MKVLHTPMRVEAEKLLLWAHAQNPGPWYIHSKNTARAAKTIAAKCGMDADAAFVFGLLHDIGRYEGITDLRHVLKGHMLMTEQGYPDVAKICLTHSFPARDAAFYIGDNDCNEAEYRYITERLSATEYDDYDRLIQFCDAIAGAKGIGLLETRLFEVAMRRGVNEYTLQKWKAFGELKTYFSQKCRCNVYSLFYNEICKTCVK